MKISEKVAKLASVAMFTKTVEETNGIEHIYKNIPCQHSLREDLYPSRFFPDMDRVTKIKISTK